MWLPSRATFCLKETVLRSESKGKTLGEQIDLRVQGEPEQRTDVVTVANVMSEADAEDRGSDS